MLLRKKYDSQQAEIRKLDVDMVIYHTIHPYKHTTKNYLNMKSGQKILNAVVHHRKIKQIRQKSECIIFIHQDSHDSYIMIELYAID